MKAFDIVAYTFQADLLCPSCTVLRLVLEERAPETGEDAETVLNILAAFEHVNREDERTFDSDDFPKVVFGSQIDAHLEEVCGDCGVGL
jgi:predicted DsbA family dithiol-disulfide isomerase